MVRERAQVVLSGALFIAMGLPILMGYGVVPLTNFGVEVVASIGLGAVLISSILLLKNAISLSLPLLVALTLSLSLSVWIFVKSKLVPPWAVSPDILVIYVGYALGLGAAIWAGYLMAMRFSWPWVEKTIARILLMAGCIAALGSVMQYLSIDGSWMMLSPSAEPGRTYGFVRQPNHQSTFLNLALACALYLRAKGDLRSAFWYPLAMLFVAAVLSTGSRTGLLQLLLLIAMYGWIALKNRDPKGLRQLLELLAVIALCWGLLYYFSIAYDLKFYGSYKISQTGNEGLGIRGELWRGTWAMIQNRPWTGHVIHSFMPTFLVEGYALKAGVVMENAHNMFLQSAYEFGLPAAIAIYLSLIWISWSVFIRMHTRDYAKLIGAMLMCILLHAQLEYPMWYSHFLFLFGLLAGIFLALLNKDESANSTGYSIVGPVGRLVAVLLSTALGGAMVYAAIGANRDFYRLTPLFVPYKSTSLTERIEAASNVFWFREVYDLVQYRSTLAADSNTSVLERSQQLRKIGCVRDEPWYQSATLASLANEGYIDDVKWMVFIMSELNPKTLLAVKANFANQDAPWAADLRTFIERPQRVEPSYRYFNEMCYGRSS